MVKKTFYQQSIRILLMILILLLPHVGISENGMIQTPTQSSVLIQPHDEVVATVRALANEQATIKSATVGLRDPTRPPSELMKTNLALIPVQRGGSILSTIIFSPHRKLAIINDRIVGVGDKIGSIEVLRINMHSVEVRDNRQEGRQFTLMVHDKHLQVKKLVTHQEMVVHK